MDTEEKDDTYMEQMRMRSIVSMNSRAIREEKHLSTAHVSMKSGLSRHTISAIENMQSDFSLSTLAKLAKAEEVTIEQLLSSSGSLPSFVTFHSREAREYYAEEIKDIVAGYSAKEEQELRDSSYRKDNLEFHDGKWRNKEREE